MAKKSSGFGAWFIILIIAASIIDGIDEIPNGIGTILFRGIIAFAFLKPLSNLGSWKKNFSEVVEELQETSATGNNTFSKSQTKHTRTQENGTQQNVSQEEKKNIKKIAYEQEKANYSSEQIEFNKVAGNHNLDGKSTSLSEELKNLASEYSSDGISTSKKKDDLGTSQVNPFSLDGN